MNKIVCNVCGTSYPENAAQCPICGFARSAELSTSADGNYTHIKGGRFSKTNVKKRNHSSQTVMENSVAVKNKSSRKEEKSNLGMAIIAIILLLAIIAVVGYIALRFFMPNDYIFEGLDDLTLPTTAYEPDDDITEPPLTEPVTDTTPEPEDETLSLECIAVTLNEENVHFDSVGDTFGLIVVLDPIDTTDILSFESSDESVATVTDDGLITSVSEGSAVITVTCGNVSAECTVTCTVPTTEPATEPEVDAISLNRKEITFDVEGQSWLLYEGSISASDIVWTSDDNKVATIEAGKVTAVGNGDTIVYAIHNGQTVSCIIHCKFDEEGTGESGGVSEAGGDTKITYSLYNPNGYADDVTLIVGEEFTLKLVDENKNEISDAVWKVDNEQVCSYTSGIVKALTTGTSSITATYDGTTYTCIVRVK